MYRLKYVKDKYEQGLPSKFRVHAMSAAYRSFNVLENVFDLILYR